MTHSPSQRHTVTRGTLPVAAAERQRSIAPAGHFALTAAPFRAHEHTTAPLTERALCCRCAETKPDGAACLLAHATQVYAVAAANITIGFTFTGVEADSLSPAATAAVKQTASNMAGGYSQQLITVSTTPPAASQAGSQVELQATVQDASTDAPAVVKRGKDLGGPAPAAAAGRRLHAGSAAVLSQLAAFLDGGSSLQQQLPEGALSLSLPRRFLQGAASATAAKAAKAAGGTSLPVWLLYKHVAPANTTALLMELCSACNVTPSVAVGYDFAPQPCGQDLKAALEGAGVKVNDNSYSQLLAVPPTVSVAGSRAVDVPCSHACML